MGALLVPKRAGDRWYGFGFERTASRSQSVDCGGQIKARRVIRGERRIQEAHDGLQQSLGCLGLSQKSPTT